MSKKIIIKTRLLLFDKEQVLLLKQTRPNGGKYTFVGGQIESEEFAKASLIREADEEAGLKLEPNDLRLVHVLHKKDKNGMRIILYFKAQNKDHEPINREPHKFKSVSWHRLETLPKSLSGTARHVLKMIKVGSLYSEVEKKNLKSESPLNDNRPQNSPV